MINETETAQQLARFIDKNLSPRRVDGGFSISSRKGQWQLQYEVAGLRARVPPADCVIRSKLHKAHTYSRRGYLAFCEQVFQCRDRVALWSSGGDLGAPPKETELVRRFIEP
jgi:hypothetical protein